LKSTVFYNFYISITLFFSCSFCYAQTSLFPSQYGVGLEYVKFYNPSIVNKDSKFSIDLGNQFFSGQFNKIENHYLLAGYNFLGGEEKSSSMNLGLKFVNEKEGEFITMPRYYLSYSWNSSISEEFTISAGANIGVAGYSFKATNVSAGGSSNKPDADIGISLLSEKLNISISANQLFNSVVTPKSYAFQFQRFYTLFANKKLEITDRSALLFYGQATLMGKKNTFYSLGLNYIFFQSVMIGGNYIVNEKYSFQAGFKKIEWQNNEVDLIFGYNIPDKKAISASINSYELVLSYRFLR